MVLYLSQRNQSYHMNKKNKDAKYFESYRLLVKKKTVSPFPEKNKGNYLFYISYSRSISKIAKLT